MSDFTPEQERTFHLAAISQLTDLVDQLYRGISDVIDVNMLRPGKLTDALGNAETILMQMRPGWSALSELGQTIGGVPYVASGKCSACGTVHLFTELDLSDHGGDVYCCEKGTFE